MILKWYFGNMGVEETEFYTFFKVEWIWTKKMTDFIPRQVRK